MKVHVHYLGLVRIRLNKKEEDIEVPAETSVINLLMKLSDMYGECFRREVLNNGDENLAEGMAITINGIALVQIGGLKAKLSEGDQVMLLPFFAGGG
ncbi:MoaD/ThiS family protein [Candidatus Bathyarchaeota archaeon]|nr:MoaD/ThiS family protein [Candidatus Bathyarchaeota archaeon]